MFEAGKPACPVACKYCFITEHDTRRESWNRQPRMGLNKACSFVNVTPWIDSDPEEQTALRAFPWDILTGDTVGFTAVTDPLWPALDRWLWHWLENASRVAKLTTCVSKWPASREVLTRLATYPNFRLVVTITGLEAPIERVSVRKHLETLRACKEIGLPALPIIHPYIAGLSDLSFLPELARMGYSEIDVKGFRYCDAQMRSWMPEHSRRWYAGREDEEVLPEDGWRQLVEDAGFSMLSPRRWYQREATGLEPRLSLEEAQQQVRQVCRLANVVTSATAGEVVAAAVQRRL